MHAILFKFCMQTILKKHLSFCFYFTHKSPQFVFPARWKRNSFRGCEYVCKTSCVGENKMSVSSLSFIQNEVSSGEEEWRQVRWKQEDQATRQQGGAVQCSSGGKSRQSVLLSLSKRFTWTSGDRSICLLHTTAYMCEERPRYRNHAANQQIVPIYRTYSAAWWKATNRSERDKEKRKRRENS